ncbi:MULTISPECIES: SDR family oxidoreductase [unclassified Rhodococcus (in: high G+C Gram-positive bacteria)]|uniref:SDR family oxidoreductase n=1 Tax=unclassified Rhodococcus (in: high G+C Gram-positive bacteria) TaxID=192944 RepID=UPI001C9B7004|nr:MULTISPECIES: SDR family oxidoreductase [unclassified Rhodococcus (in: high G+C Gram-positive bacteria)]
MSGAAGGIGRATAVAFGELGANVVVADLEHTRSDSLETVELVRRAGGDATFVAVDVADARSVENLILATVGYYGRLDFAHNNAGILTTGFTADISEDDFDRVLAVDVKGVWLAMKYEISYMRNHGGGTIVNTASEAGLVGTPMAGAYVAAKHAVVGLTKTAAGEYANMGIRINAIAPGAIETPMVSRLPREGQDMLMAPQPLHRFGTPEEVAEAVVWLSSDKSSFVLGAVLSIDGGATSNAQSFDPDLSPST